MEPGIKVSKELIQGRTFQQSEVIPFHKTLSFMPEALQKNKARIVKCKWYHYNDVR